MEKLANIKTLGLLILTLLLVAAVPLTTRRVGDRGQSQDTRSRAAGTAAMTVTTNAPSYYTAGMTFDATINLNANASSPVIGADVILTFDPTVLQVVGDTDTGTAGIQVTQGTVLPSRLENLADNTLGVVRLSMGVSLPTGGVTVPFTGQGVYGSVRFQVVKAPTATVPLNVNLPFATGTRVIAPDGTSAGTATGTTVTIALDNTPPPTPALTAQAAYINSTTPTFNWSAVTGTGSGLANYVIELGATSAFSPVLLTASPTTNSYSGFTLTNGSTYWWRVRAVDRVGNVGSNATSASGFVVDTTRPTAISNLSTSGVTTNAITLNWSAPNANPGSAISYEGKYATTALTDANFATTGTSIVGLPVPGAAGAAQTVTVSGLTAGTTYYFAVRSSDQIGASLISNVASATTVAPAVTLNFSTRIDGAGISTTARGNASVVISLKNSGGVVTTFNGILAHSPTTGVYSLTAPVTLTGLTAGNYSVMLKAGRQLSKLVSTTPVSLVSGANPYNWESIILLGGETNADNVVDLLDFVVLARDYMKSPEQATSLADFNYDAKVDLLDFVILARNYRVAGDSL